MEVYYIINETNALVLGSYGSEKEARDGAEHFIQRPSSCDKTYAIAKRVIANSPVRVWE